MVPKSQDGQKLCIQSGNRIKLQPCNETNTKQLWRADASGQIRSRFGNEKKCLTHVRRENGENLIMDDCEEEGKILSKVFVYNGFQNTILWIKSDVDWAEYGLRAISVKTVSINELVTLEAHYYDGLGSSFFQSWYLIYPDIALS